MATNVDANFEFDSEDIRTLFFAKLLVLLLDVEAHEKEAKRTPGLVPQLRVYVPRKVSWISVWWSVNQKLLPFLPENVPSEQACIAELKGSTSSLSKKKLMLIELMAFPAYIKLEDSKQHESLIYSIGVRPPWGQVCIAGYNRRGSSVVHFRYRFQECRRMVPFTKGTRNIFMKIQNLVVVVVLLISAGCVAGAKFSRLTSDQISLGKTTEQEIRHELGKPYEEGVAVLNNKTFKSLTYGYSKGSLKSLNGVPKPMQIQVFFFHGGVLSGQFYSSTLDKDATNFDETRLEAVKKGETTVDEATKLLGPPSGEYVYPMTENAEDKQLVYVYTQTTVGFNKINIFQKILKLTYGPDKIISKIEYVQTGNK